MADISAAKQTAKRLFKKYNLQDGPLGSYEISALLKQTYDYLQIPFSPSQNDVKGYGRVLDADNDGQITLKDLQTLAILYLCGDSLLSKPVAGSSLSQSFPKNEYSNSNSQNNFYQYQEENQIQNNYQLKSTGNQGNQSYGNEINYNFTQSYSNQNTGKPSWQASHESQSYSIQNSYSNKYDSTHVDNYESSNYQQSAYQNNYHQQYEEYPDYNEQQQQDNEDRPYSDLIRQYLAIVGQVFLKYADKVAYTVTEKEVPDLLTDTYAVLGRDGYYPTSQDVKTWMKLCDVNRDGKVEYQDYQFFVVKSLQRSGIDLYD